VFEQKLFETEIGLDLVFEKSKTLLFSFGAKYL